MKLPPKLPCPDDFGNYWLSGDHARGPALFAFKTHPGQSERHWTAFTGEAFLMSDNGLSRLYFDEPEKALAALRNRTAKEVHQCESSRPR